MISSPSQESRPTLLIDLKKNRIRIHKATLHMLGNPDYIQFLVNPMNKTIAVRSSLSNDPLAHHIRWNMLEGNKCCEFYSKSLIRTLRNVGIDWEDQHAYMMYGDLYKKPKLAKFPMDDSFAINSADEELTYGIYTNS